ncbi:Hypothetical_protein [Hexamita inflata]|uniref:Hypothetical_protein n=1 Tax=Hexamita inflata TaxID=28002 RepID=A0AA86UIV3_9EUKA|nr:Hypothetical protein HINF_LOCUS47685 [Hexamita inflata]
MSLSTQEMVGNTQEIRCVEACISTCPVGKEVTSKREVQNPRSYGIRLMFPSKTEYDFASSRGNTPQIKHQKYKILHVHSYRSKERMNTSFKNVPVKEVTDY